MRFSCGFSGPTWDIYYQPHFDYCMAEFNAHGGNASPGVESAAVRLDGERRNEMRICKDKFSTEQIAICQAYSEKASAQAVFNFRTCGRAKEKTEGRWTFNADEHFGFCTAGFMKYETDPASAKTRRPPPSRPR